MPYAKALLVGVKGASGAGGCERDVDTMVQVLQPLGYAITVLKAEQASTANIVMALNNAAAQLYADDIFIFAIYAISASDRPILDDELSPIWRKFRLGVRIVMLSDIGYPGINDDHHLGQPLSNSSWPFIALPMLMKAQLIHLSNSHDEQQSEESETGGAYTQALKDIWGASSYSGNYAQFQGAIGQEVNQRPLNQLHQRSEYHEYGQVSDAFRNEKPFTVGNEAWPSLRYCALWTASAQPQAWWPNCSEGQLRAKTNELWGNMRLTQIQACVINGLVRYNGIWNPGTVAQIWWLNCDEAQLRTKTNDLWDSMRLAYLQAFVFNGQVRFNALWNAGTHAQVWLPFCDETQLLAKTRELRDSMRLAQIHPCAENGEVRYSAVWNADTQPQAWLPNCSEAELHAKTGELWGSMRLHQLHGFVHNGQVRYSCIWNTGTQAQVWWPLCTESQVRTQTDETWSNMRLAQLQAFRL